MIDKLLARIPEILTSQHQVDVTPELMVKAKKVKGYQLSEFQANLKTLSDCATHCASEDDPAYGDTSQHQETCQSCFDIFHLLREIKECANCLNDSQMAQEVAKIEENLNNYI